MNRNNDEMDLLGSEDGAADPSMGAAPADDMGADNSGGGGGIASVEVAKSDSGGYQVNVGYSAGSLQEAQKMAQDFHSQMGDDEPAEGDMDQEPPEGDESAEPGEMPPVRGGSRGL